MNEIKLCKRENCYGCFACFNICPKNAISVLPDKYGFLYPKIDSKKCINCGLCKKVCINKNLNLNVPMECSVAVSNDDKLLLQSSSGAIFAALAIEILNKNGTVYGCSMEYGETIYPKHIKIQDKEDLYKLQGSKYAKSDINTIYKEVKNDLKNGRFVLFSGIPCQIAGLKSFLEISKSDTSNLYAIDIICHGTPSSKMFIDYIKFLEKKLKGKIINLNFRNKKYNWTLRGTILYKNTNNRIKEKILYSNLSSYYKNFLAGNIYRENCYSCMFAQEKRIGDITIGDYWGIENEHPEYLKQNGGKIDIQKGVSCLLINSEKGKKLIREYGNKIMKFSSEFEKIARHNGQLLAPSKLSQEREKILEKYSEKGYSAVDDYYYKKIGLKKYFYKIYYLIK